MFIPDCVQDTLEGNILNFTISFIEIANCKKQMQYNQLKIQSILECFLVL